MKNIDTKITHITPPNGNIFEDLGFEVQEASQLLHVTRPRVSDVLRGKSGKFTIDALVDMLERIGKHVTVQVN